MSRPGPNGAAASGSSTLFAGVGRCWWRPRRRASPSYGVESHPFVARVARAKLKVDVDVQEFRRYASELPRRAERAKADIGGPPT